MLKTQSSHPRSPGCAQATYLQVFAISGFMAALAYISAFCTLVWISNRIYRLLKIYLVVPEDSAFISSKSVGLSDSIDIAIYCDS